jgi:hypothetical protein
MREKLAATMGEVFWSDLRAHAARDALVVVDDGLDLLDVGEALATDDARRVGAWIEEGKIKKPSAEELARWPGDEGARFESLIVAPFVLIRPRGAIHKPN